MKKKLLICGLVVLVLILSSSILLLIGKGKDDKKLDKKKDYSFVSVSELKRVDAVRIIEENLDIKDVRINDGLFECIVVNTGEEDYKDIDLKVVLFDKNNKELDEISFKVDELLSYEEKNLFFLIENDLSSAYYIDFYTN